MTAVSPVMGKYCSNGSCQWYYSQDHTSTCIACGEPLSTTPAVGSSSDGNPSPAHISSTPGVLAHGYPSPTSPPFVFVNEQNSPTDYGAFTMHNASAFSHLAAPGNVMSPHQSTLNHISNVPKGRRSTPALNQVSSLNFEYYDPNVRISTRSKAKISCISCCIGKRKCVTQIGQIRCQFCIQHSIFCTKDNINMETLGHAQPWFQSTILRMPGRFGYLDSMIKEASWWELQIRLNPPTKPDESHAGSTQTHVYRINLRGLRENVPLNSHHSQLWDVLDMVFPDSKRSHRAPRDSEAHSLENFENLCCYLVACLVILRNPQLNTVDVNLQEHPAASCIVLGFLRQLSCEATCLFRGILEALNEYLGAKRKTEFLSRQVKCLGFYLGLVYSAFMLASSEVETKDSRFAEIPSVPPSVSEQVKGLGNAFNANAFNVDKSDFPDLVGVHLTLLLSEAGVSYATTSERKGPTFLQIIHSYTTPPDQAFTEVNSGWFPFNNIWDNSSPNF